MGPALAGLVIGLVAAFYATRIVATFLFETTPHDPATFAAVAALIIVSAGLAAWRAATVDPLLALRVD